MIELDEELAAIEKIYYFVEYINSDYTCILKLDEKIYYYNAEEWKIDESTYETKVVQITKQKAKTLIEIENTNVELYNEMITAIINNSDKILSGYELRKKYNNVK